MAALTLIFAAVGAAAALRAAAAVALWAYAAFLRPAKDLRRVYGEWAVVTGPTDGIGKAMAFELARKGINLVLVGRSEAKLAAVAAQLAGKVATKSVVVDLAVNPAAAGEAVGRAVEGLDVGLLVSNAGMTHANALYFHEMDEKEWLGILAVNAVAMTSIAHAVVRLMIKRGGGKRAAVVNVGSGSSEVARTFPLRAVYAATKAYIYQFSKSLSVEYKHLGIDVQCHIPMFVKTNMTPALTPSLFVPTAEQYAEAAVRSIGYEARCIPYWAHGLEAFMTASVPTFVVDRIVMAKHIRERNDALARAKEQ